jgi:Pseudomonas avirulence D protein (AvrD)
MDGIVAGNWIVMQNNTLGQRGRNQHAHRFGNIDELLGDASGRYFGSGYLRTRYSHAPPDDSGGKGEKRFLTTVAYPQDWSMKAGVAQHAHLSTIDAVYLATMGAEEALKKTLGQRLNALQPMLTSLTLKSGSAAYVDLDAVGVFARIASKAHEHADIMAMSSIDVEGIVGNMNFGAKFALLAQADATNERTYSHADTAPLLGLREARACERSFKASAYKLIDVEAGTDFRSVSTRLSGLRGDMSVALAVVIPAQLAQVAIYMSEGGRRDGSNPLWMRSYSIERSLESGGDDRAFLTTRSHKQVRQGAQNWGVYQFLAQVAQWKATFTFAHVRALERPSCES